MFVELCALVHPCPALPSALAQRCLDEAEADGHSLCGAQLTAHCNNIADSERR